jgi:tRNA pseudouridine55 synthase
MSGVKRVGHAGTLDPAATGVLPVCLGRATRVIEFMMDATKTYRADIELGVTTDTYDAEGKVVRTGDASSVTRGQLEAALTSFSGAINQVPPLYSALKYQGRALYEYAREGIGIEPESRPVTIHRLDLLDWQMPVATVEIECSKGTYVRSLAHDLGEALGCGAHLKSLIRLKYGIFDISEAVDMETLEEAFNNGSERQFLHSMDSVLTHLSVVTVDENEASLIANGRTPDTEFPDKSAGYCRVYKPDGTFLAVMRFDEEKEKWRPEKVFI